MIQAFSHYLCQYWLVTDQTDRHAARAVPPGKTVFEAE